MSVRRHASCTGAPEVRQHAREIPTRKSVSPSRRTRRAAAPYMRPLIEFEPPSTCRAARHAPVVGMGFGLGPESPRESGIAEHITPRERRILKYLRSSSPASMSSTLTSILRSRAASTQPADPPTTT
jgi:hypothetical protein